MARTPDRPSLDRTIAGMTCREVLASLSDYLDGELAADRVAQLDAHLRACRECDRFGGRVGALVLAARRALAEPASLAPGIEGRLHDRLRAQLTGERDASP